MSRQLPLLLALIAAAPARADDVPVKVATCTVTRIARLQQRLQDGEHGPFIPGSGSAVVFANGVYQVSYEEVPEVQTSRVGDRVTLCLIQVPRGCPAGDTRGRVWTATNLRTMASWTLPNAEHTCGGA